MTPWILAVLGLWFAQVFFAASFRTVLAPEPSAATADHMRGKDRPVVVSLQGARAERAKQNLLESLPVFLGLALLLEMQGQADGLATQGAMVFFVGRLLYAPAYHMAIFGLRTAMWTVGLLGLGMMTVALLG